MVDHPVEIPLEPTDLGGVTSLSTPQVINPQRDARPALGSDSGSNASGTLLGLEPRGSTRARASPVWQKDYVIGK